MIDHLTCDDARALLARGGQLIDVRTPAEYHAGALPGAQNLPVEAIQHWIGAVDRRRPVLLYCRSGARSGMVKNFLRGLGFHEVYNLGAYHAWRGCAETAPG